MNVKLKSRRWNPLLLGWFKSNCDFTLLNFAVSYWNTFLNVIMLYIILMCISHFFFFFANDLLKMKVMLAIGSLVSLPFLNPA